MGGTSNFYGGAGYGLESNYSEYSVGSMNYKVSPSEFGVPSDPRTSNQLQAVSNKLNTGIKTIEVSGVALGGEAMSLMDTIPKQQFQEINRLKKLTGIDLTFHGPLVEPTGIGQGRWDEIQRRQAETQMLSAVERGHQLDPKGNLVITFHSSNGLPEAETWIKDEKGKEKLARIAVINERTGEFGGLPPPSKDYLLDKNADPVDALRKMNNERWAGNLSQLNAEVSRGRGFLDTASIIQEDEKKLSYRLTEDERKNLLKEYDLYKNKPEEMKKVFSTWPQEIQELHKGKMEQLQHGELYLRDAWTQLQELYNNAYQAAMRDNKKDDVRMLDEYGRKVRTDIQDVGSYIKDPTKLGVFADRISEGLQILGNLSEAPQTYRPLKAFAIDKASETFANVAFKSYQKFEKDGNHAPIIGIENPPAGMGLSRAGEIKELVEESQKKFVKLAMEKGMGESEAQLAAKKVIGVTWDVGHINMIRKQGYDEKDVIRESEKIAPHVKHVHLSDNFGLEHTELPMGMGNVPTNKILELHENFQKAKKIIETGGWFRDFKTTPFRETLAAFGSPVYSMKMAPYWNQTSGRTGGYFAGYGNFLPEQHFQMYGSGFSNLPVELGGQMSGRNRLSGAPIE
ncbi:hypothetical protein KW787_03160 [Candidatus Pacearchaeota archaeon]|nr:hypothetical protein [Candidatus Pacearchaeota archaeon]